MRSIWSLNMSLLILTVDSSHVYPPHPRTGNRSRDYSGLYHCLVCYGMFRIKIMHSMTEHKLVVGVGCTP